MQVGIAPIEEADLPAVGQFLNQYLNQRIPPETWVRSLIHPWCNSRPNFGFQARDGDRLVGVFCAIYSDQTIDGCREQFCNPHSWCMLSDYRSHSLGLVLHLLRQRGYHFTPPRTRKVAEIFLHLGSKLDDAIVVFPNPIHQRHCWSQCHHFRPGSHLQNRAGLRARDCAHRAIPWLEFVAFGATMISASWCTSALLQTAALRTHHRHQ